MAAIVNQSRYSISLLDMCVLLCNLHRSKQEPNIGYLDSGMTIEELTKKLEVKRVFISKDNLERALYACNMLDELGQKTATTDDESILEEKILIGECAFFWHPNKEPFENFVKNLTQSNKGITFDRKYNLLLNKRKRKTKNA